MEQCWSNEPKQRPSFKEIVQLLLVYLGEEGIARIKFRERSFYFEDLKRQQMKPDEQNHQSRKEFKKDYLNDKDLPPDDGSDRPLTETEKSDLMDSTFIQYNNSNTSSENHRLSDFTTVRGDQADEPVANHQQNSEFLENGSVASGTDSNDKDDLDKQILVKPEQVIVQIQPLNGQPELRKSRQESISCQSSSSASESNGENFENLNNLIEADSNAPLNGNLPNGNIMLNS